MKSEQVSIIGAGPAGIAAAIQLQRCGLAPLIMEKGHVGGLLVNANLVENYPGFPKGIAGADLVELFKAQLIQAGVTVSFEEVRLLDFDTDFILSTSKREVRSSRVIVASGTTPRPFDGLHFPPVATGRILYEVYPIMGVRGKTVAIVGAGDAAFDYALNLGKSNKVVILNRGGWRRCLPLLWERIQSEEGISYLDNATLCGLRPCKDGLVLSYRNAQMECELVADYVIFAIGRQAQRNFLSDRLTGRLPELEESGRLYFVGDVGNGIYRQASIAIGDGIRAAMNLSANMLRENECG